MPRYSSVLGRYVRGEAVTPVPAATRSTNSDSGWLPCDDFDTVILTLAVTAQTGSSPTNDVVVQTADAAQGNVRAAGGSPFAQKTGTGASSERKSFTGLDAYYRVGWTIGGTGSPSSTFSVTGEAKY